MVSHPQTPGEPSQGDETRARAEEEARRTAEDVRSRAEGLGEKARAEGERLSGRAREQFEGTVNREKDAAAGRVESVAEAVHASAERLRSEDEGVLADWVQDAAKHLDGFSSALRQRDVNDLFREFEAFGRRHPAVFMGAAVAVGFGLARFAVAGPGASQPRRGSGYGGGAGGYGGEAYPSDRYSDVPPERPTRVVRPESEPPAASETGATVPGAPVEQPARAPAGAPASSDPGGRASEVPPRPDNPRT